MPGQSSAGAMRRRLPEVCQSALSRKAVTLLFAAAMLALTSCDKADVSTAHTCSGKGHVHRYRDGVKLASPTEEGIEVKLTTYRDKNTVVVAPNPKIAEHQNPAVLLDSTRSTDAERVYMFDVTDPTSRFRTVTSVVINQVSGDFRLFHHRWIPPAEWRESDQYFFAGNCRIQPV